MPKVARNCATVKCCAIAQAPSGATFSAAQPFSASASKPSSICSPAWRASCASDAPSRIGVQMSLKLMRTNSVRELSMVFAAVGLAQNFAALRALGSVGIQKGHMALHARCVAVTAGARGDWVEKIASLLVEAGHVKVEKKD